MTYLVQHTNLTYKHFKIYIQYVFTNIQEVWETYVLLLILNNIVMALE